MCVHIHAVNTTEPDHEMKEDHITENDIEQKREGLANLIPSHKNKEICSDVLDLKQKVMKEIAELSEVVQRTNYNRCLRTEAKRTNSDFTK